MITFKEYIEESNDWVRASLRKHGSVKPGHWNGKKFVTDLSKADSPGFDHERCKAINAQVEVAGKVVAGGLRVDESVEESELPKTWEHPNGGIWDLKHLGEVEGRDLGAGGKIDVFKGNLRGGHPGGSYFIRGQRIKKTRMVSSEHTAVKRLKANQKINEDLKLIEENLKSTDVQSIIGKTRFNNLIKHPYYKKFAQGTSLQPTAYKHSEDEVKHVVQASNDGKTMVAFHLSKISHKVTSAHLFKHEGDRHSNGQKMWVHVASSGE